MKSLFIFNRNKDQAVKSTAFFPCAYAHSAIVSAWMRLIELATKVLGCIPLLLCVCSFASFHHLNWSHFTACPRRSTFSLSLSLFLSCTHPLMYGALSIKSFPLFSFLFFVAVIVGGACACLYNFPHTLFIWNEIWCTILESELHIHGQAWNRSRRLLLLVFVKLVDDDTALLPTYTTIATITAAEAAVAEIVAANSI